MATGKRVRFSEVVYVDIAHSMEDQDKVIDQHIKQVNPLELLMNLHGQTEPATIDPMNLSFFCDNEGVC